MSIIFNIDAIKINCFCFWAAIKLILDNSQTECALLIYEMMACNEKSCGHWKNQALNFDKKYHFDKQQTKTVLKNN